MNWGAAFRADPGVKKCGCGTFYWNLAAVMRCLKCGDIFGDGVKDGYRRLAAGEIIQEGDEVDVYNDGWHDDPVWRPATCIGEPTPDPRYPSHRLYRRKIAVA